MKRLLGIGIVIIVASAAALAVIYCWNSSQLIPVIVDTSPDESPAAPDEQPAVVANAPRPTEPNELASVPPTIRLSVAPKTITGFPEVVTVHAGNEEFTARLTGRFTRTRSILFIPLRVYEIASYIEGPVSGTEKSAMLDDLMQEGKREVYLLRFLRSLSGSQILTAIREEINWTFTDVDMKKVGKEVERFVQTFANGSTANDLVYLVRLPGGRIYCSYNKPEALELICTDLPLSRAIWRIWAGETAGPERFGLVEQLLKR